MLEIQGNQHYSHHEVEAKWTKFWLENKLFETQVREGNSKFSIALPPPNVTGELHMGHALGGTIQDVLIRYNRMLGKDVLWQIGTDHAGIGTQIVVEKQIRKTENKSKDEIGRDEFIRRVKIWKEEYGNKIIEQMKLMGFSADYKRIRYTMDDHYAAAVRDAFIKYFNDGIIYRGNRITNWCPKCLTSLSDLEITKEECKKKLYQIKYKLQGEIGQVCRYLTVATTRPETMFGDTAVAINPNDKRFADIIQTLKQKPGSVLALIPFTNKAIPVILDESVKTDFGTGALKVTPAHDANDYEISQRHNLAKIKILDGNGRMSSVKEVPDWLHGLDRFKARDLIIEKLEDALSATSEYNQEKDLHDRCNTEIEPYLSDQWYVGMKGLAKKALEAEASGRTGFIPERYSHTFKSWLENIQDWCVSRQIWWGHRIPVYYYDATPDSATREDLEKIAASEKNCFIKEGKLIRYFAASSEEEAKTLQVGSLWQDNDVLDTWFSSALWPFETLKSAQGSLETTDWDKKVFDHYYPTDVLATAREIINLWVSRMIFSSQYFEGVEPFKDILIHPVVQTPDGKRMSKSKGNAIDPIELINKYGADASRMWYASVGIHGHQDVKFPGRKDLKEGWVSEQFEQYRKFANKLFNASRFVLMQIDASDSNFKPGDIDLSEANTADIWILDKFTQVLTKIEKAFTDYDLTQVQKEIYGFLWFDFCDWYIELSKVDKSPVQNQVLYYILEASLKALHPIMPFITEELWQLLKSKYGGVEGSICFATYPKANLKFKDQSNKSKQVEYATQVISTLRNIRQSLNIAWSNPIKIYYRTENIIDKTKLTNTAKYIINLTKAQLLEEAPMTELPKPLSISILGDTQIIVPLQGLVDLDKLQSSIEKKISKAKEDIDVLEKRLSSENFTKNANAESVQEARDLLNEAKSQKLIYEGQLASLGLAKF